MKLLISVLIIMTFHGCGPTLLQTNRNEHTLLNPPSVVSRFDSTGLFIGGGVSYNTFFLGQFSFGYYTPNITLEARSYLGYGSREVYPPDTVSSGSMTLQSNYIEEELRSTFYYRRFQSPYRIGLNTSFRLFKDWGEYEEYRDTHDTPHDDHSNSDDIIPIGEDYGVGISGSFINYWEIKKGGLGFEIGAGVTYSPHRENACNICIDSIGTANGTYFIKLFGDIAENSRIYVATGVSDREFPSVCFGFSLYRNYPFNKKGK